MYSLLLIYSYNSGAILNQPYIKNNGPIINMTETIKMLMNASIPYFFVLNFPFWRLNAKSISPKNIIPLAAVIEKKYPKNNPCKRPIALITRLGRTHPKSGSGNEISEMRFHA